MASKKKADETPDETEEVEADEAEESTVPDEEVSEEISDDEAEQVIAIDADPSAQIDEEAMEGFYVRPEPGDARGITFVRGTGDVNHNITATGRTGVHPLDKRG